jgi:hypothetical protein
LVDGPSLMPYAEAGDDNAGPVASFPAMDKDRMTGGFQDDREDSANILASRFEEGMEREMYEP